MLELRLTAKLTASGDTLTQELMPTPMMGWNGWLPTTMLHTGYLNNETMCAWNMSAHRSILVTVDRLPTQR